MLNKSNPARFEPEPQELLCEGAHHVPRKKQELIRLANIQPWPGGTVEKAYRQMGQEWDALEAAATQAQGSPDFND